MEITGKIIAVLPANSGTSARTGNPWMSQAYVIETQGQYPKKLAFDVFGEERIKQFNIQQGEDLTVSFDIDAHEYNGRWFNQIRAYNVEKIGQQTTQQPTTQPTANVANQQAQQQAPQQHVPQQQNMFNAGEQNATPYQPTQQPQAADPNDLPF